MNAVFENTIIEKAWLKFTKLKEVEVAKDSEERKLLKEAVNSARDELKFVRESFSTVNDCDLADYYTYSLLAAQSKYRYLLKKLKDSELK